ncbi:MAG: Urease beta subunit / Urease gamma subunit [Chloroflexi bacterium]|nr:Urease beta subunit / Urease gamma subunit [Chloroflexota bacterium]
MRLTAWEEERMLVFSAAELARRHRDAGLLLNAPEAVALICDAMFEAARAGATFADVEAAGRAAVQPGEAMPGVPSLVDEVRLEVLIGDGTRLIVLLDPLGAAATEPNGPGSVTLATADLDDPAAHLERRQVVVRSASRRVIHVSSHFPFHRVNRRLEFDRGAATGFRLDIPAGSSERWAPGETRTVSLVRYAAEMHTGPEIDPEGAPSDPPTDASTQSGPR